MTTKNSMVGTARYASISTHKAGVLFLVCKRVVVRDRSEQLEGKLQASTLLRIVYPCCLGTCLQMHAYSLFLLGLGSSKLSQIGAGRVRQG